MRGSSCWMFDGSEAITSGNNCRITARVPTIAGWHKKPEEHAQQAAGGREHDRLAQELRDDVALLGAQRAANADLARPLGHGGQHDVHDADAADQQRDARDQHQQQVEHHLQALGPAAAAPWAR